MIAPGNKTVLTLSSTHCQRQDINLQETALLWAAWTVGRIFALMPRLYDSCVVRASQLCSQRRCEGRSIAVTRGYHTRLLLQVSIHGVTIHGPAAHARASPRPDVVIS